MANLVLKANILLHILDIPLPYYFSPTPNDSFQHSF